MGCDIHMIAERKSRETSKWEPIVDPIFKNVYFDKDENITRWNCPYIFQPYDIRNYEVFSVLANVRNGWDIKPISEPRGFPDDIHPFTEWLLTEWDYYDHSPTWLFLDEVLKYDWNQPSEYQNCETLADSAKEFLESMGQLKSYREEEGEDIRLVFGFDN